MNGWAIAASVLSGLALAAALGAFKFVFGMSQRVTSLETKIEPLWKTVAFNLAADLKHNPKPSDLRMNELIDKFVDESISGPEIAEFARKLDEVQRESESSKERIKAGQLLRLIDERYQVRP